MNLVLYHGTIETEESPAFHIPSFDKCNIGEFGKGFYLSNSFECAYLFGKQKADAKNFQESKKSNVKEVVIHEYEIKEPFCCLLEYTKYDCELWESFIDKYSNEKGIPPIARAVSGPIKAFQDKYDRDFIQYAFLTEKALGKLKFVKKYSMKTD